MPVAPASVVTGSSAIPSGRWAEAVRRSFGDGRLHTGVLAASVSWSLPLAVEHTLEVLDRIFTESADERVPLLDDEVAVVVVE